MTDEEMNEKLIGYPVQNPLDIIDEAIYVVEFDEWKVNVFGERCGQSWEISVVRDSNKFGQKSWGWFDENKLLVSHNHHSVAGWAICGFVWDRQIEIATELCRRLNNGEDVRE